MLKWIKDNKTTIAVSALSLMAASVVAYSFLLVESTKLLFSYVKDWEVK